MYVNSYVYSKNIPWMIQKAKTVLSEQDWIKSNIQFLKINLIFSDKIITNLSEWKGSFRQIKWIDFFKINGQELPTQHISSNDNITKN